MTKKSIPYAVVSMLAVDDVDAHGFKHTLKSISDLAIKSGSQLWVNDGNLLAFRSMLSEAHLYD